MPAPLLINQRPLGAVAVLELNGPLVANQDDAAFTEHIRGLIREGVLGILLDMEHVTAMDSGGVGVLAAMHLHVVKRGGRLALLRPSDRVDRVLAITHLSSVFERFESEDEAIVSFARSLDIQAD